MSGEGGDGFLSRWSRLKREADKTPERETPATDAEPVEAEPDAAFDPAALEIPLPSLEDLKPGDSLKAFMQKGVPEVLKNAALRKMWALDPMVRDFRSEALDYAWDWNTPGGVPGTGPLGAADKVEEMVDAIFRAFEPPAEETDRTNIENRDGSADEMAQEAVTSAEGVTEDPQIQPETASPSEAEVSPRRRHGGALPQV